MLRKDERRSSFPQHRQNSTSNAVRGVTLVPRTTFSVAIIDNSRGQRFRRHHFHAPLTKAGLGAELLREQTAL